MRILLVNDYGTASGGVERVVLALRAALRARGHDARLFTSTAADAANGGLQSDFTCYGTTTRVRTPLQAMNPWAARALRRALRAFRPDVVHAHIILTQLSPSILPLLRGVPAIHHVHWYRAVCPIGTKRLPDGQACHERWGTACLARRCLGARAWLPLMLQRHAWRHRRGVFRRVIACGAPVRDRLREDGVDDVEVVWNGVREAPARPPLAGPPAIAYTGRFSPEKGVDVLVRAFARVVRDLPDARLVLAGDGPSAPEIDRLVAALGLAPRVHRAGWVSGDALEQQVRTAWVHAVPSTWVEPFGLSAAEALMRGTAVVASASGTLPELVAHGRSGLLVEPGCPAALAGALLQVLRDRAVAERMGAEGRRFALARLTESVFVDRMIELYTAVRAA